MQRPATINIADYHNRTKHDFGQMAKSAGYLDWANQPHPFRFYHGTEQLELPLLRQDPRVLFPDLVAGKRPPARRFCLENLAGMLELSLGLAAWKEAAGAGRWVLRINPSSGNLHPTEAHLVLGNGGGLDGGIYHYDPYHHRLERRAPLDEDLSGQLGSHFGGPGFLVALTSIFWRESWKYGERAYRYCLLDAGHGMAALALAAGLFGWCLNLLPAVTDEQIGLLLGFDKLNRPAWEQERPQLLAWVSCTGDTAERTGLDPVWLEKIRRLDFKGRPSLLSKKHHNWKLIEQAAVASAINGPLNPGPGQEGPLAGQVAELLPPADSATIIRRRRSAAEYDASGKIDRRSLLAILGACLPRTGAPPLDGGPGPFHVSLMVFLHRVESFMPGLYCLAGSGQNLAGLKKAADPSFRWEPVDDSLPFYRLQNGDFTRLAAKLCCRQNIAGDSAFSLAMLVPFTSLVSSQPWYYRLLHWQCGMVGQILYLAAEACNLRGTGIGCYFDDPVHRIFGLRDETFQSLYHFTVGHGLEDRRLKTLAPYHHLQRVSGR